MSVRTVRALQNFSTGLFVVEGAPHRNYHSKRHASIIFAATLVHRDVDRVAISLLSSLIQSIGKFIVVYTSWRKEPRN